MTICDLFFIKLLFFLDLQQRVCLMMKVSNQEGLGVYLIWQT